MMTNAEIGAQCRLSACDLRFVGPLLFTSELTGHGWRPLAVTIRSHQVDSLAATPVASVASNWLPTCGSNAARPD